MFIVLISLFTLWTVQAVTTQTRTLNDGNQVPVVGLGTFGPINDSDKITQAVVTALKNGYRHIDTGAYYLNEDYVGNGIRTAINNRIVTRKELFVTTKLDPRVKSSDGVLPSLKKSLDKLKLGYVDLYLIHVPFNMQDLNTCNDLVDIWRGMIEVKKSGLAKSIGVSNFNTTQLDEIIALGDIVPAVNEIEVNPTYPNLYLINYCQSLNITVHAYGPYGYTVPRPVRPNVDPRPEPSLNDTLIVKLATKYCVEPCQIVLRYLIELGVVILPKSFTPSHIKQNINVFGFELTQEEVDQMKNFNSGPKLYLFDLDNLNYLAQYQCNADFEESLAMI